jgi:hypothetical protein
MYDHMFFISCTHQLIDMSELYFCECGKHLLTIGWTENLNYELSTAIDEMQKLY